MIGSPGDTDTEEVLIVARNMLSTTDIEMYPVS